MGNTEEIKTAEVHTFTAHTGTTHNNVVAESLGEEGTIVQQTVRTIAGGMREKQTPTSVLNSGLPNGKPSSSWCQNEHSVEL